MCHEYCGIAHHTMWGKVIVEAQAMTKPTPAEVVPDLSAERRLAGANLAVALTALFGGMTLGLFQALEHAGVNLYPALAPVIRSYYHGLTLHGVLNVLVFTTFFILRLRAAHRGPGSRASPSGAGRSPGARSG